MSASEQPQAELIAATAAFGRYLLQERELRGLERDEVARLSKLGPGIVGALESGNPDRMPPKAYVFGYLRSYATVVGLDPDDVVLRWQEVVGPEDTRQKKRRSFSVPLQAVLGFAVVVAVAVLAITVLFSGPRERAPLKLDRPRAVQRAPYGSDQYSR